jgi:hypothetical protein
VSAVCVVIAIGLRDSHPSATFKAAYVALVLVAMNAIAATATARAAFVRLNRRWPPNKGDVEELP